MPIFPNPEGGIQNEISATGDRPASGRPSASEVRDETKHHMKTDKLSKFRLPTIALALGALAVLPACISVEEEEPDATVSSRTTTVDGPGVFDASSTTTTTTY